MQSKEMSNGEKLWLWMGGYRPSSLRSYTGEDRQPITLFGAAVMIAAVIAALSWATAGWMFATGSGPVTQTVVAAVAGSIGLAVVVLLDRAYLYLSDTGEPNRSYAGYMTGRLLVILLVHSMTAAAITPKLLGGELQIHGQQMYEQRQESQSKQIRTQLGVEQLEQAAANNAQQLAQAQALIANPPADLLNQESANGKCWAAYNKERAGLLGRGFTYQEMLDEMAVERGKCRVLQRSARAARAAFEETSVAQLSASSSSAQEAAEALKTTQTQIAQRREQMEGVAGALLNPLNSTVLWDLLSESPAALIKYLGTLAFLMVLELLPLLIKLQAGRTIPGQQIGHERSARRLVARRMLLVRERDHAAFVAVSKASTQAIEEAMNAPQTREAFTKAVALAIGEMAPAEAARVLMGAWGVQDGVQGADNEAHQGQDLSSLIEAMRKRIWPQGDDEAEGATRPGNNSPHEPQGAHPEKAATS